MHAILMSLANPLASGQKSDQDSEKRQGTLIWRLWSTSESFS